MMSALPTPNRQPEIRKYLKDVLAWHGYVRFLGMPTLQNTPDVPLDELYVGQSIAAQYLSSEDPPETAALLNPVQTLLKHRAIAVLGDPGAGKSTLLNWFAWYLASGFEQPLPGALAEALPVPIILRELALAEVKNFADLLAAALQRPVAAQLPSTLLADYIEHGTVLFLIDGLDEVSTDQRTLLRAVIAEGIQSNKNCFFIISSRVVGYENIQLGSVFSSGIDPAIDLEKPEADRDLLLQQWLTLERSEKMLPTFYIAPFSDQQISQFSFNWYREQMDGMDVTARYLKDQFVSSIFSDDNTKRLSRTPHLLTMMALIFRKRAHLPNGRAILYDAIAQAYLESIDQARGIKDDYDWQLKKILLARVAFEMQLQRLALEKNDDFLVEKTLVLGWIKDEMAKHSQSEDSSYVDTFLNWIARRSGLLLPRGVDQYAFLHLSFQEYFAAVYIQSQLENPAWFDREDAETLDDRVSDITFPAWANEVAWSQTLIFLYELMSKKSGWSKRLWRYLFEQQPQPATEDGTKPAVIDLKWSFISNRHCVIDKTMFEKAKNEIFQYSVQEQQAIKNIFTINLSKLLLNQILNTESLLQDYIDFFQKEFNSTNIVLSRVDFSGKEEFLQAISKKQLLEFIHIENCSLDSLPNFNTLKKIRHITIKSNKINELDYDFASEKIHKLTIGSNEVNQQKNIKSLQNLKNIESLTLHQDFDSDLSWIAKCTKIQNLTIIGDFDCNMIAPAAIKKIKSLTLISNHIARTEKIALMDNLEYLIIMSEQTLEIDYFHNFNKIKIMMLSNVHSNNWNSLLFLPKLTILTVNREFIDNSVVDTLRNKGVHVDFVD
jgi:internalin A